jgi:hypothetical protein
VQHGRKHQRGDGSGNEQKRGDPPAAGTNPLVDPNDGGARERPGREDQRVDRCERLQRHRGAEQHRVLRAAVFEQAIEREQRQRQELEMLCLDMRQPYERLRVERRNRAADDRRREASRHPQCQKTDRPSGQREPRE